MKLIKKQITGMSAIVLALAVTLSACGTSAPVGGESPTISPSPKKTETPTSAVGTGFKQSPYLDGKDLADVAQRLPENPKLIDEIPKDMLDYEIGTYGGELKTVTAAMDWDADVFVMCNESILNTPVSLGEEIFPNIVENYTVNADATEYIFKLRKNLHWSDGSLVTMEDFRFTFEDVLSNKELYPVFPQWLKSEGSVNGAPVTFKVIDDETYSMTFDKTYGGFLLHLSAQGLKGYTELLKPSSYLKSYIKGSKEYDEKKILEIAKANNFAEDDQMWINVFNKVDITNWELNRKEGIGFPKLYPWLLKQAGDQVYTYERNPYYFKTDSEGNQLPYIDEIKSELVQDMEMVTMKILSGDVDLARESATMNNMSVYKENEKNGFLTLMPTTSAYPGTIYLNLTYDDPTWRLVTQNKSFRQALNFAMDKKEIIDTVYLGYAEPSDFLDSEFSIEKANKLLDEMGMDKKDKDGFRLAPNGKPFEILFEVGAEAPDIIPVTELVCEMWSDVGIKSSMKRIEATLVGTKQQANELQARTLFSSVCWFDWGIREDQWAKTWDLWRKNSTNESEQIITESDGSTKTIKMKGEVPPKEVQDYYAMLDSLLVVPFEKVPSVRDSIKSSMKENVWYFQFTQEAKQPVIIDSNMGNITDKCMGIALNMAGEQLYFKK